MRTVATLGQVGGTAAGAGAGSVIWQYGERFVNNTFYGQHQDLFQRAGDTFLKGATIGAVAGFAGNTPFPKAAPKVDDFTKIANAQSWSGIAKNVGNAIKGPAAQLAVVAYKEYQSGQSNNVNAGSVGFNQSRTAMPNPNLRW